MFKGDELECLRCGFGSKLSIKWTQKRDDLPHCCPKCKSTDFDLPIGRDRISPVGQRLTGITKYGYGPRIEGL